MSVGKCRQCDDILEKSHIGIATSISGFTVIFVCFNYRFLIGEVHAGYEASINYIVFMKIGINIYIYFFWYV